MKKKLALLMAAIMTVAMVPMTAFAATDVSAVDTISTAVDTEFESRVTIIKDDSVAVDEDTIDFKITLTNGEFTKDDSDEYIVLSEALASDGKTSILDSSVVVKSASAKTATITISKNAYTNGVTLTIVAEAIAEGDVYATFSSNNTQFGTTDPVKIATAYAEDIVVESEGVVTFVEDADEDAKLLEPIRITTMVANGLTDQEEITLKLSGNYRFVVGTASYDPDLTILVDPTNNNQKIDTNSIITFLNDSISVGYTVSEVSEDTITIGFASGFKAGQYIDMEIYGIYIEPTSKCDAGDEAKLTVKSADISSTKLVVAKMVEESVTYTVDDDDLPVIYAGAMNEDENTLKISIEENAGDILNTSRKATFTFPDGIEVVSAKFKGNNDGNFTYSIDENVVTIKYYGKTEESTKTDLDVEFVINAAPTYEGDVTVTLGGEFDDVEFTVATVQAPYTIEAKTSEVLIDYRYVPVNEIVITEAEAGLLVDDAVIFLEVEKMDFEDAGTYEVTEGDIEVDVDIVDGDSSTAQLIIEVTDESTEASTITISGLELYLDRTLPVGGYALKNIGSWTNDDKGNYVACNILWENSSEEDDDVFDDDDPDLLLIPGYDEVPEANEPANGIFKYSAVVVNDSYVEVVTAARDQDDSTTSRKIVITIGATTMSVGTETITLDAPAYINSEDYTMLPVRAISEAFGATVTWDDASKTVTVLSGQRIISMTIGSKTMYINGTPVAMNTAAEITNDRTFIPVRDLANSLGISAIDWNEASATVTLN